MYQATCTLVMLAYDHIGAINQIDDCDFRPFLEAFHCPKKGCQNAQFYFSNVLYGFVCLRHTLCSFLLN